MQIFQCQCGIQIFFDNTHCEQCQRTLGYDPHRANLLSLESSEFGLTSEQGFHYRFCQNQIDYHVCNWLIDARSPNPYCLACQLNQMIPSLTVEQNRRWWQQLEVAKRRLIYSLLQLQLPVQSRHQCPTNGLGFAFIEDQRSNPQVHEEYILTGYANGLITVNVIEADEVSREWQRILLGEPYRTLLGHFRHESGHYYFDRLIKNTQHLNLFQTIFGDFSLDYDDAIARYYAGEITNTPDNGFISRYAQAHPLEDWAECWAHYLHMMDTLDTAIHLNLLNPSIRHFEISQQVQEWSKLSVMLNSLNRSMGLNDAYPFVLSDPVIEKLSFIHNVITNNGEQGHTGLQS